MLYVSLFIHNRQLALFSKYILLFYSGAAFQKDVVFQVEEISDFQIGSLITSYGEEIDKKKKKK